MKKQMHDLGNNVRVERDGDDWKVHYPDGDVVDNWDDVAMLEEVEAVGADRKKLLKLAKKILNKDDMALFESGGDA